MILRNIPIFARVIENCINRNNVFIVRNLRGLPRQSTALPANVEPNQRQTFDALDRQLEPHDFADKNIISNYGENRKTEQKKHNTESSLKPFKDENKIVPTFNLAAYVNKSTTLQEFIKLGVNLHKIERRKGLAEFVLRLNFDEHVKPYLIFLKDQGVPAEVYGELITKNPLLFKESIDDLTTRVNYLESKNFTPAQRKRIFTLNPYWLMFSTSRIDRRLGYFQQEFRLKGDDVRFLATIQPKLITYNMEHLRKLTFCIREEMGFDADETKYLLLKKPSLWLSAHDRLIERFAYAHDHMGLSHDMLIQFPEVLKSREFRLRQRHEFLKMLGRAQYNPEKDMYISPKAVVEGTEYFFVRHVAKSTMETYELFLKTL
ncbi:transcription termination factor 3, mitochondrial [Teleopsis dalmanni]|uniref:transcription termination factor 3, mitochondrial n=1 Tax=Teleopsis dalmanni TaxID=139649 RepID=UPI0018CCC35C|nr:transcription termination factor 3, mitochondrial [Teleopsis dalmanni]